MSQAYLLKLKSDLGTSQRSHLKASYFSAQCPPADFQTWSSSLCWPDCPAYWSFDPQGAERLSMKDATQLGFPSIVLITEVRGYSWDKTVYVGLCQFHQAKGFDPDSQEVAWYLGESPYQLSPGPDVPFAYVMNINDESDGPNLFSCTTPTEKSDKDGTFTERSKITEVRS
ncbi:hypothetical protein K438DRAFT_2137860 [Mycena galopus ATCC 62051]|nr:hypothetical protein K438DRAFT_2137860 [Mycena galopus ATCC 62051]